MSRMTRMRRHELHDVDVVTVTGEDYAAIRGVLEKHRERYRPLFVQHDSRSVIVLGALGIACGVPVVDFEGDGIMNSTCPEAELLRFSDA